MSLRGHEAKEEDNNTVGEHQADAAIAKFDSGEDERATRSKTEALMICRETIVGNDEDFSSLHLLENVHSFSPDHVPAEDDISTMLLRDFAEIGNEEVEGELPFLFQHPEWLDKVVPIVRDYFHNNLDDAKCMDIAQFLMAMIQEYSTEDMIDFVHFEAIIKQQLLPGNLFLLPKENECPFVDNSDESPPFDGTVDKRSSGLPSDLSSVKRIRRPDYLCGICRRKKREKGKPHACPRVMQSDDGSVRRLVAVRDAEAQAEDSDVDLPAINEKTLVANSRPSSNVGSSAKTSNERRIHRTELVTASLETAANRLVLPEGGNGTGEGQQREMIVDQPSSERGRLELDDSIDAAAEEVIHASDSIPTETSFGIPGSKLGIESLLYETSHNKSDRAELARTSDADKRQHRQSHSDEEISIYEV